MYRVEEEPCIFPISPVYLPYISLYLDLHQRVEEELEEKRAHLRPPT